MEQIEQGTVRLELHKQVDIARFNVIAPRRRSEQRNRPTTVPVHRSQDLSPLGFDYFPTLTHNPKATPANQGLMQNTGRFIPT